jgi:MFS family permease
MSIPANRYLKFSFCLSYFLIIFGLPGQSVSIRAITDSILGSTGLSRKIFSIFYICSTITECVLVLPGGFFVDKIGIRRTMFVALTFCALIFLRCGTSNFHAQSFPILRPSAFGLRRYFCTLSCLFCDALGQIYSPCWGWCKFQKLLVKQQELPLD